MKILIHSKNGDSNALAMRFMKEGHKVQMFNEIACTRASMEGMVEHVSSMSAGMKEKPDFVLFDREGDGDLAARLIKAGVPVVGGHPLADKIELDRDFGIKTMEDAGIRVPKTTNFTTLSEAVSFVRKNPNAYAMKLDGNKGAASSYVSKDDKDMIEYMTYLGESGLVKPGSKFILQEKVDGTEVSTEVWFAKGKPVLPYNTTFETKKFMPGDLGPNTGCETSVVCPYPDGAGKMVKKTIAKIFPLIEKEGWSGPLDINCIVSDKDHEPYALEWTARLGYSAVYAWAAMIEDDLAEFFFRIATGKTDRIRVKHSWGTALRLTIPPYPFENPEKPELEQELFEETAGQWVKFPEESKHIWLLDVKKDEKKRHVTAGVDGTICECTGVGENLYAAWKGSQKVFDSVNVPNKQGRYIDGTESAWKRINKLISYGYDIPKPQGFHAATKEVMNVAR